jgi:hypothetical protein
METALSETQYLLKRWQLSASATGYIWIKPTTARLSPEELAGFLALLKRTCESNQPRMIMFDFHEVQIVGQQWTTVESLLLDLTRSLHARCRVVSSPQRPVSAFFIYQNEGEFGSQAAPQPSTPAA